MAGELICFRGRFGGEKERFRERKREEKKQSERGRKNSQNEKWIQKRQQDPTLLAAVEAAEAAREGRRHKGGDRGGIAEEDEEEEEEEEGEGGTSKRRVIEVEGEESLPLPMKRGAALAPAAAAAGATAAAAAAASVSAAGPIKTDMNLPPAPTPPIAVPRASTSLTAAEENGGDEEEEEFGTPKSECSFVSAFSTAASATAAAAAAANGNGNGNGGESAAPQVPLLERVHRLEASLPAHAARVRAQSRDATATDPLSSKRLSAAADLAEEALRDGRGTLMMRVGQLEAAVAALVEAETFLAAAERRASEKSRVACCSVM